MSYGLKKKKKFLPCDIFLILVILYAPKNLTIPFCLKFTFFSSCPYKFFITSPFSGSKRLIWQTSFDTMSLSHPSSLHVTRAHTHMLASARATKHALAYAQLSTSKARTKTASRPNKWALIIIWIRVDKSWWHSLETQKTTDGLDALSTQHTPSWVFFMSHWRASVHTCTSQVMMSTLGGH